MSPQETKQPSLPTKETKQSIDIRQTPKQPLLLEALEWSETEIKESYYRLKHIEDDWNASEMDAYDDI